MSDARLLEVGRRSGSLDGRLLKFTHAAQIGIGQKIAHLPLEHPSAICVLLRRCLTATPSVQGLSSGASRGAEASFSVGQAGMYLALLAMVVIVLAIGIAVIAIEIKPPWRT